MANKKRKQYTILIYCEGENDYSFVQHLRSTFDSPNKRIKPKKGEGGGPPSMIQKAAKDPAKYREKYILLDLDKDKNKEECEEMAKKHYIKLIWSDPCLEGLFLQILNGHSQMSDSQKCKSLFRKKHNSDQRNYDLAKLEKLFPKEKLVSKKEKIETLKRLIEIINNVGDRLFNN